MSYTHYANFTVLQLLTVKISDVF